MEENTENPQIVDILDSMDKMISVFGDFGILDSAFNYLLACEDQSFRKLNFDKFPEEFVDEFCEIVKEGSKNDFECVEKDVMKVYTMENNELNLFLSEKILSQKLPIFSNSKMYDYSVKVTPYIKKFLFEYLSNSKDKSFSNLLLAWAKIVPSFEEMRAKLGIF